MNLPNIVTNLNPDIRDKYATQLTEVSPSGGIYSDEIPSDCPRTNLTTIPINVQLESSDPLYAKVDKGLKRRRQCVEIPDEDQDNITWEENPVFEE